jgi:hypothetical protein
MSKIINNVDLDKVAKTTESGKRKNSPYVNLLNYTVNGILTQPRNINSELNCNTRKENK